MKIKKRYTLLAIAISLFIADFGLTWYFLNYTSYVEEGNPLFTIDGGYLSLFVNFLYAVVVFIIGYKMEQYQTIVIEANSGFDYFKKLWKSNRTDFISISFLSSFVFASFFSRLTVITDWIIYGIYQREYFSTGYAILRDKMPFERYDLIIALLSFWLLVLLWYKIEYRKSKEVFQK
jgi:uncharacterized protein with PQ loop repeat